MRLCASKTSCRPKMWSILAEAVAARSNFALGQWTCRGSIQYGERPYGYVDSRWAWDTQQRKRTSGRLVIAEGIVVKSWSRTQRGWSLSSVEAGYHAIVTGAAEALAEQVLVEEMTWKISVSVPVQTCAVFSCHELSWFCLVQVSTTQFSSFTCSHGKC